jgi:hypothetical protein
MIMVYYSKLQFLGLHPSSEKSRQWMKFKEFELDVRFEVFMVARIRVKVFWVVML